MSIDEYITRFTANAKFERTHGNLQGCLEFRQLAEWLRALQKYDDVLDKIRAEIEQDAFKDVNGTKYIFVNRVNQIIDKHRNEVNE